MNALKEARQPIVVRDMFTVKSNPHFGIEGGWKVEIVWVASAPCEDFWYALPNQTRLQLLQKDFFPNYDAGAPTSHFELSAISQYASWMTQAAVAKEVQAMLNGEPVEHTEIA